MKKLIVYGTLLMGEINVAHYARGIQSIVTGTIKGRLYDTGWGYPAFVPDANGGEIQAELFILNDETYARIEILEGYPNLYRREEIECKIADGKVVKAPVYIMNKLPARAREITNYGGWRTYRHGSDYR